jgi:DNA-binding LacI/PurR family transcriptional regulator
VQLLLAGNVDGLILVVSNPSTSKALARLRTTGTPYVLAYNRHADHPCVTVDSEAAVADAVARLVLLGHRRIAMVSGTLAASDRAQQRVRGYQKGMADAGLKARFADRSALCRKRRRRARQRAAGRGNRPTALVCSNDLLAIRSIRAAHLGGLSVPDDLSVIGFDGIALGEDLTPALTTIAQPNSDIGRHSVELLIQAMAGGTTLQADASLLLPHTFRDGESCASACDIAAG